MDFLNIDTLVLFLLSSAECFSPVRLRKQSPPRDCGVLQGKHCQLHTSSQLTMRLFCNMFILSSDHSVKGCWRTGSLVLLCLEQNSHVCMDVWTGSAVMVPRVHTDHLTALTSPKYQHQPMKTCISQTLLCTDICSLFWLPRVPESSSSCSSGKRRQTCDLRASSSPSPHRPSQRMALTAHQWVWAACSKVTSRKTPFMYFIQNVCTHKNCCGLKSVSPAWFNGKVSKCV